MASIAGLYGGNFGANQEDGSGGRVGFFGGLRSAAANKKGAISEKAGMQNQSGPGHGMAAIQAANQAKGMAAAAAAAAASFAGAINQNE